MSDENRWFVRAGREARFVDQFISDGHAALGWGEIGRLELDTSEDVLRSLFERTYPKAKPGSRSVWAAQIKNWTWEVEKGDSIVTYDPSQRMYFIGEVTSGVEWREHDLPRARRVKWARKVPRDVLSQSGRNALGSIATLFRIRPEVMAELLQNAVALDAEVAGAPRESGGERPDLNQAADEVEPALLEDITDRAAALIEDRITALTPYEMQDLVGGILRAMGYKTRISEPGPDRGVDLFASPDGLGLQEPRIFVEVKHRVGAIGSNAIRSFLGGRQAGDKCLYVSTGGFTREARYEAERAKVPLTLVALPELRELLVEHYDAVDARTRQLVPLQQVYWPVE
jgi:restriction system protein